MLDTPTPSLSRQGEGTLTGPFRNGGKTGISPSPRGKGDRGEGESATVSIISVKLDN
jgi:hypothetical protein